jgi:hypothetical protein
VIREPFVLPSGFFQNAEIRRHRLSGGRRAIVTGWWRGSRYVPTLIPAGGEDGLFEQFAYGELPGNRYCAARSGYLWFTVNDNSPKDSSGALTVILTLGTCLSAAEEKLERRDYRLSEPWGLVTLPVLPSGAMLDQVIVDYSNNTATSTFAGGPTLTRVMELRSTMNITRRWVVKAPNIPGSYRLKLVYYDSRNMQTTPATIYSPTFEVQ